MNFEPLKKLLDSVKDYGIPGCDCAIWYDHQPVFRYFTGVSDIRTGRKMSGDEFYYIYSASKPITCATALTLYDKGKFLLSDPLYEYLPEYRHMTVCDENGERPAERDITIRDLFTMSAGFDYDTSAVEIKNLRKQNPDFTLRDLAMAYAKRPLHFEPGTHFQYSMCHDIIGALIEVISGKSLGKYMREAVLEPTGMCSTGFHSDITNPERMAALYEYDSETENGIKDTDGINVFRLGSAKYESGGAGLVSCVEDYIKFADMMSAKGVAATGERILSEGAVELMRTNQRSDFNWPEGYGYGLGVRVMLDRAVSGSTGSIGEFGWDGAAGAYTLMDPEKKLSVFYAQHVLGGLTQIKVHPRIRNVVYACI